MGNRDHLQGLCILRVISDRTMVKSDLHGLFAWVMSCYAWVSIEIITMLFFYGNTLFIFPSLIFLVSYSRWSEIKDIGFGKRNNIYCMRNAPLYLLFASFMFEI